MAWRNYVALGDSLSAGYGDTEVDGQRSGWTHRLANLLSQRTGVTCQFTNLAQDGAVARQVRTDQVPAVDGIGPDLVSVTVGMNDIQAPDFGPDAFAGEFAAILQALAATRATLLTATLPNIADLLHLPATFVPIVTERMRQVSDIIREQAAAVGAVLLDAWTHAEVANPAIYHDDRLHHPNAQGHELIATAFADLLTASTNPPTNR